MKPCIALLGVSLLLCALLNRAASVIIDSRKINTEFEKFKAKFGKEYENRFEEFLAKIFFTHTLKYIEDQNKNDNLAFKLSVNAFADQSPSKIRQLTSKPMTALPPSVNGRAIVFLNAAQFPPGPPSIDFRDTGCVTPVKDQSYFCNACYAFSGIAALETHWCLKNNVSVTLSEQQAITCGAGFFGNLGCRGGSPGATYMYIETVSFGIESDTTYPYNETISHPEYSFPCLYSRERAVAITSGYFRIRTTNETQIANVLAQVGPISAAMNGAVPSFWYYYEGVYNDLSCTPGRSHSVLIVGYGTDYDENGEPLPYWICKNSWSADWGDQGYFKILRGVNLCGITSFLIYPDVPVRRMG